MRKIKEKAEVRNNFCFFCFFKNLNHTLNNLKKT